MGKKDIKVVLAHPYNGKAAGTEIHVDAEEAERLAAGGYAALNKTEEKKVEQAQADK